MSFQSTGLAFGLASRCWARPGSHSLISHLSFLDSLDATNVRISSNSCCFTEGDLRWFTTETCLTVMNSRIHIGKTGSIFPGTSCNSLASWSTTDKRAWPFILWHCHFTLGCSTKATAWEGASPAWSDLGPTSYTVQLQWERYFAGKDM